MSRPAILRRAAALLVSAAGFLDPERSPLPPAGNSRNLKDLIWAELASSGHDHDVIACVEDVLDASPERALEIALAGFRHDAQTSERMVAGFVEAILAARTYEGWLRLMDGRPESEDALDVRADWRGGEIVVADRHVFVELVVNRQPIRVRLPTFEAWGIATGLCRRAFIRDLNRHRASDQRRPR